MKASALEAMPGHSSSEHATAVPGRRTLTEVLPPAHRNELDDDAPTAPSDGGSPLAQNRLFGAIGDNDAAR